ncbi:MAG TPA: hypothetical protein VKZ51_12075 [Cyclobacteriaceae bacterium]|nr:hypothetical protein [Cyclobacteriaceae bacterium]
MRGLSLSPVRWKVIQKVFSVKWGARWLRLRAFLAVIGDCASPTGWPGETATSAWGGAQVGMYQAFSLRTSQGNLTVQ